jgi:hypothetical protein
MRIVFIVLSILIFYRGTAQIAIIKDPDGFSNVRQAAGVQAKLIDTLHNNNLVFVYAEAAEGNWLPMDYKKGKKVLSGYVHKSRILLLNNLTKFALIHSNDSTLNLRHDNLRLVIQKGKFATKGRRVTYEKPQGGQQFLKSIDGKYPWGTDGNIPREQYKFIQFKSGSRTLNFPQNSFENLFEPNLTMTTAYIDKSMGRVYLEAVNSDGAGGYCVVWTIKESKIISIDTFIPF